jgi:hypothetical protein
MSERCLHCGAFDARERPSRGDYEEFECRNCGIFQVSKTSMRKIEGGTFGWPSRLEPGPNGLPMMVEASSP